MADLRDDNSFVFDAATGIAVSAECCKLATGGDDIDDAVTGSSTIGAADRVGFSSNGIWRRNATGA